MGVFDWVTIGRSNGQHIGAGKVEIAIGTSLEATFGTENTHVLGSSYKQVCDPMQFLFGPGANPALGLAIGVLMGIGGEAKYVFGASTELKYMGPMLEVSRGPSKEKTTEYYATPLFASPPDHMPPLDPIDPTLAAAVRVLGVLQVVVPAAFELIIHFKYGDELNPSEYHKELENLKFCAYAVTSRIAAVIRVLEMAACDAQVAARLTQQFVALGTQLAAIPAAIVEVFRPAEQEIDRMDDDAMAIENNILAALRAMGSF